MAFKLGGSSSLSNSERADQEAASLRLVEERIRDVGRLCDCQGLDEWSRRFAEDLRYKAETYDSSGTLGGRLAGLTEKQVALLYRLIEQHEPAPSSAPLPSPFR